jgi:multicomponent Na+:H+ antiporter subunit G
MSEALAGILAVAGAFFAFVAALGVLRMPDVYIRMHTSTKAGTLGCGLLLLAVAIRFGELGVTSRAMAAIAFLLFTAPVAAHSIARAAYRAGVPLWRQSVLDELGEDRRRTRAAAPDGREDPRPGASRA